MKSQKLLIKPGIHFNTDFTRIKYAIFIEKFCLPLNEITGN